jgi:hypothetical protein
MDVWDMVFFGMIGLFSLGIASIIMFLMFHIRKYCHAFIINEKTNGVSKTTIAKAKISKDKTGFEKWVLRGFRNKLPPTPPAWAIKITKKGNFLTECDYSDETGFLYHTASIELLKQPEEKKENDNEEEKTIEIITATQKIKYQQSDTVLSVNAKNFLADQWKKSYLDRPNMSWQDVVVKSTPWIVIVFIIIGIISMFALWQDVAQPSLQANKQWESISKNLADATSSLQKYSAQANLMDENSAKLQDPETKRPDQ